MMFLQAVISQELYADTKAVYSGLLFGVLFIVSAGMARIGVGYAHGTRVSFGRKTIETVDACGCGIMTGIAILGLTSTIVLPNFLDNLGVEALPTIMSAFLGGTFAILAGIVALMDSLKTEVTTQPTPTPLGGKTCPFCGKTGISPEAPGCLNCGQPFKSE